MSSLKFRLRAFGVHLLVSLGFAASAACLVFGIWYPYPYVEVSGGRELFMLLMGVDVMIGPTITLLIFNPLKKGRRELFWDCAAIAALQLAALGYGVWSVAAARPVHLVFEYNRFTVVHANQIPDVLLRLAPEHLKPMPWTGPTLLSLRPFRSSEEQMNATVAALSGDLLAARVDLWQPYDDAKETVLHQARPLVELKTRHPEIEGAAGALLARFKLPWDGVGYLPMVGRKTFWTVLVDRQTAEVLGFIPVDSF